MRWTRVVMQDELHRRGRRSRVVLVSSIFDAKKDIHISNLIRALGNKKGTAQTGQSPIGPTSSDYRFGPREAR
jgi:hypothetical protein